MDQFRDGLSGSVAVAQVASTVFSAAWIRATPPPPSEVMVGASLTGVTVSRAVSVAAENAVLPPLTVVSAKAPLLPLVRSQARR